MESSLANETAFTLTRPAWEERERSEAVAVSETEELRATRRYQQELFLRDRGDKMAELESVERHRVNIPREYLAVRRRVCEAAGVAQETMPFAGELIEVQPVQ
jgi:uncharacterized protein YPO0396